MATNRPVGDNSRVGAVRGRSRYIIRQRDYGLSEMHKQENSWM
jgi:hypothetical protein